MTTPNNRGQPAMKPFLVTFYQLPPEAKAELFQRAGLHGANQTALHLYFAVAQ